MIAYLKGEILVKANNYLILKTNNIGYQIFVAESFYSELQIAEEKEFYISHQVREDSSDLYGFRDVQELALFELLLSVSGVGPKSAIGVLAMASTADIKEAVIRGDANLLTKVAGIGKKTAERIILELKTKILKIGGANINSASLPASLGDELDALMSLGYALFEARQALSDLDPSLRDGSARLKAALKKLSKKI